MLKTRIWGRTLRHVFLGGAIALLCGSEGYAQPSLSLSSGSGAPGTTVALNLSLNSTGVSALQWRVSYPLASIASVTFSASSAVTAAGKTLSCVTNAGWTDCVLYGLNTTNVPTGVVATVSVSILSGVGSTTAALSLSNTLFTSGAGVAVAGTGSSGSVSIVGPSPTWTLSGNIEQGSGATVTLSGAASRTVTADASGNYAFTGLASGSYTVTPSKSGMTMSPLSRAVSINGASVPGVNFIAVVPGWSISGTISSGAGATVALSGAATQTVTADASGNYRFTGLANGSYTIRPALAGSTMSPGSRIVNVNNAHLVNMNFTAVPAGWTISGNITSGAGATVALSGPVNRTVTADSSGNYSFAGLLNGTYTVSPSRAGFTMTPGSRSVTVNNANSAGVNFTAAQVGWTISGTITSGAGATVALSGAASRTVTADASGNYSFTGLANGTYTVTPTRSGYTMTPSSRAVTVNGVNVSSVNFSAAPQVSSAPTVDTQVWRDYASAASSFVSPPLTTSANNELLLAFVTTAFTGQTQSVTAVSGGGLTWRLVRRTNGQGGTAEIWRAFAPSVLRNVSVTAQPAQASTGSVTIVAFRGVDASAADGSAAVGATGSAYAARGAAAVSLVTTREKSLVFAVGNDPAAGMIRSLVDGQRMVHEFVERSRATHWMQQTADPTAAAGMVVTMATRLPTFSAFNLTSVEVRGPAPGGSMLSSEVRRPALERSAEERNGEGTAGESRPRAVLAAVTGEPGDACSPGGWASVLGEGFTGGESRTAQTAPLPRVLEGVRVEINGQAVPLLFASDRQIHFQCPYEPPGTLLDIRVVRGDGFAWEAASTVMSAAAPALFALEGSNRAIAQLAGSEDTVLTADAGGNGRAARAGDFLRLYATGLGRVDAELPLGTVTPLDRLIYAREAVRVFLGEAEIEPAFAGLAPGMAGVFQLDVQVPSGTPAGSDVPLYVRVELPDGTVRYSQVALLAIETPAAVVAVVGPRDAPNRR